MKMLPLTVPPLDRLVLLDTKSVNGPQLLLQSDEFEWISTQN